MARFINNEPVGGYHGVTTRMQSIQSVCDYEEKKIELNTGYPRFVTHPEVRILEENIREKFDALSALSFCSFESALFSVIDYYFNNGAKFYVNDAKAEEIVDFLQQLWGNLIIKSPIGDADIIITQTSANNKEKQGQILIRIKPSSRNNSDIIVTGDANAGFVILYKDLIEEFTLLRRNIGFCLSSRRAERINKGKPIGVSKVISSLQQKISKLEKTKSSNCLLCPSGMAAVFSSILSCINKDRTKLVSIGNLYVDTLCILENWPKRKNTAKSGIIFEIDNKEKIEEAIDKTTAAVVIEVPTNPLLEVADLDYVIKIARQKGAKVIIDSTIATPYAINPLLLGADVVVHSTTKFLNGKNDHIGGAILAKDEELLNKIRKLTCMANLYLDEEDARVLDNNILGFEERMEKISKNALEVANFLNKHPLVQKTHYPYLEGNKNLDIEKKYLSKWVGLVSFVLKESNKQTASLFYDNLKDPIIKGPSLGAEQTLLCPYTLLAHYECSDEELKKLGLDRYLFRISVGTEDANDIIASLEKGFKAVAA